MQLTVGGAHAQLGNAHDISIAVNFSGDSVRVFGAQAAKKTAYEADGFVGDVQAGGSCNCDMVTFSPHLHGTHTECVGHIVGDSVFVHDILSEALVPASLVSIIPQAAASSEESYVPALRPNDWLLTRAALEAALKNADNTFLDALVVRTKRENPDDMPPFFSIEAMEYLNELGVSHLLVDMPSIDRLDDEGHLTGHHIFWGVEQGASTLGVAPPSHKTVTEFIHVPDSLADGTYVLNLQVAAFEADAAPSRPQLYEIKT